MHPSAFWWTGKSQNALRGARRNRIQATDRDYYIDQDKLVIIYKLITTGSVKKKISEMPQDKQAYWMEFLVLQAQSKAKLLE